MDENLYWTLDGITWYAYDIDDEDYLNYMYKKYGVDIGSCEDIENDN